MTILNTLLFALGVLAIAAPLYVHLRLGKVKKRQKVSSLHLMLAARQTSQTPRRIVNWPLFLLRCLVLLLLAFGFGRLLLPWLGAGASRSAYAVIVVDVSGSMQAREEGVSPWNEARERLEKELSALAPSSRVAIIPSPMGNYQPIWESPDEALERATKLAPGFAGNRLATELRAGITMLGGMPEDHPKELRVISDFQHSALAGVDQLAVPANLDLQVDKVGPMQARNRGLTVSVQAAGVTSIRLYAFNDGTSGTVGITENGKSGTLAIEPGRSTTSLANDASPQRQVDRKLVLDEADALAADNVAYDAFPLQEAIPVWLFEPRGLVMASRPGEPRGKMFPSQPSNRLRPRSPEAGPPRMARASDQATYYLGTALQPAFTDGDRSDSRFSPTLLTNEDLPGAIKRTDEPDAPRLLFVPAVATIPPGLVDLAKAVVAKGGAVVFFSGPEVDGSQYQLAFGSLLPVNIGAAATAPLSPSLAKIDDRHPLWGGLDVRTRQQLAKVALRDRSTVELIEGARALAYYSDAMPFIAERVNGRGRVYFVNTTSDRGWGDWPADPPLFVPTIHLLAARSLGIGSGISANPPLLAGERGNIQLDPVHAGKSLRLGGNDYLVDAAGRVDGVVANEPGIIDLTLQDGSPAGRLAVNFPPEESVLASYTEPVVLQRLASLRQTGAESVVRWKQDPNHEMAAWKWCLALAALALLIEPVFANRRAKS